MKLNGLNFWSSQNWDYFHLLPSTWFTVFLFISKEFFFCFANVSKSCKTNIYRIFGTFGIIITILFAVHFYSIQFLFSSYSIDFPKIKFEIPIEIYFFLCLEFKISGSLLDDSSSSGSMVVVMNGLNKCEKKKKRKW